MAGFVLDYEHFNLNFFAPKKLLSSALWMPLIVAKVWRCGRVNFQILFDFYFKQFQKAIKRNS